MESLRSHATSDPSQLRVLHLNLAGIGGVAQYGTLYAHALQTTSDVHCLSIYNRSVRSAGGTIAGFLPSDGIAVEIGGLASRISAIGSIVKAVRKFKPHVIHDTAGSAMWMGALLWPWLRRRAALVITEHDPVPHDRMGWRLHERASRVLVRRTAALIIVHGEASVTDLVRMGVPGSRIRTELLGSFGALLRIDEMPPREDTTVLFFGAMRPNKGMDWLPSIAEAVCSRVPKARFIVAGRTTLPRSLQRTSWPTDLASLLNEFRSRPEFELHDRYIPDAELAKFFGRAAVTLLPYRDATQSGVAMLALPAGSAIVATAVGNLPDLINHMETGVLCRPEPAAIAEAVVSLLLNPDEARRIGESGRRFAEKRCGWNAIAERTIAHYLQLVDQRGKRS